MSDELDLSQVPDSEFELTEREFIIAQGGDPDSEEYQNEETSENTEESFVTLHRISHLLPFPSLTEGHR